MAYSSSSPSFNPYHIPLGIYSPWGMNVLKRWFLIKSEKSEKQNICYDTSVMYLEYFLLEYSSTGEICITNIMTLLYWMIPKAAALFGAEDLDPSFVRKGIAKQIHQYLAEPGICPNMRREFTVLMMALDSDYMSPEMECHVKDMIGEPFDPISSELFTNGLDIINGFVDEYFQFFPMEYPNRNKMVEKQIVKTIEKFSGKTNCRLFECLSEASQTAIHRLDGSDWSLYHQAQQ